MQPDPSNVAHLDMATDFPDQGLDLRDRLKVGNYMNDTYKAAPFDNEGPYDMQVVFFEYLFDDTPLASGAKITFNMYYGAATNLNEAKSAIRAVGADAYAFLKTPVDGKCVDDDVTDVCIMAFGGASTIPGPPTLMPSPVPTSHPTEVPTSHPTESPTTDTSFWIRKRN